MFTSLGRKTVLNMMVIRRRHDGDRCTFLNHVTQLTDADVLVVSNKYQEPVSPSNTSTGLHLIRHAVAHQNGVSFCTPEADHVDHSAQVFSSDRQQPAVRRAQRPQQRLRQPEDCTESTTIGVPLASG